MLALVKVLHDERPIAAVVEPKVTTLFDYVYNVI
jgi:hypothetical protein